MEPRPKKNYTGHIIIQRDNHSVEPSHELLEQVQRRLVTLQANGGDRYGHIATARFHVEEALLALEMEQDRGAQAN